MIERICRLPEIAVWQFDVTFHRLDDRLSTHKMAHSNYSVFGLPATPTLPSFSVIAPPAMTLIISYVAVIDRQQSHFMVEWTIVFCVISILPAHIGQLTQKFNLFHIILS